MVSLMNDRKINDNQWHVAIFTRDGKHGQLIVDEDEVVEGYSQGNSTTIDVNPPFFVGGVLPQMSSTAHINIVRANSFISSLKCVERVCRKSVTNVCYVAFRASIRRSAAAWGIL